MIKYRDRATQKIFQEQVYGGRLLRLLYDSPFPLCLLSAPLRYLTTSTPLLAKLYARYQKSRLSRRKIAPFIKKFSIDTTEFEQNVDQFNSFDQFFTRTLKRDRRPIVSDDRTAILPADGRYLVFPRLDQSDRFYLKGQQFDLESLLASSPFLAHDYRQGSLVIARLCPLDYHRFHFPCNAFVGEPYLIRGPLFSVNPIALRHRLSYLFQNRRQITALDSTIFGRVLCIEIGATFVGTIHQTYRSHTLQKKGAEKGFFSFGGSCLLLLFQPHRIQLDADLIANSQAQLETYAHFGESLGRSLH